MSEPTVPPLRTPAPAVESMTARVTDSEREPAVPATDIARRDRLALGSELALIGLYFAIRMSGTDTPQMTLWVGAVLALSLVTPIGGLVVLAAIAPFNEALIVTHDVGSKTLIAAVLVGSVVLRWVFDRTARSRPSPPVVLACVLLVGTGLGLIRTWRRWGVDFTQLAAGSWLSGIATMLLVFIAAVWATRHGERRPLVATLVATTIAGLLSLADFSGDATLRDTVLGWALVGQFNPARLTGVIRSPTSTAALVMLPLAVFLAALLLAPRGRLRALGAAISAPLLVTAYLTYNRAVFIALYVLAIVTGWQIRRRLGILLLIGGLAAGAVLTPWYFAMRGQAVGGAPASGQVLFASDVDRLGAWAAAGRMFLDQPLIGQGYRAYRQLSVKFGDPHLNAPHNEWLRLFAEHGAIVGLVGLGFALTVAIRLTRVPGWLGAGLLGSFLSLCIAAAFNNVFLFNQVTIPAMVMAGTGFALSRPTPAATAGDA